MDIFLKKEKQDKMYSGKRSALFFNVITIVVRVLSFFSHKLTVEGVENIPEDSAFVLLPKHQRWIDIPFLAVSVPKTIYYIAKHELFLNPFSRWIFASLGGLPLNRERPLESRRTLRAMIEHLGKSKGVVVFPEGTYYEDHMGPGNIGIVRLILSRIMLPFIPVGISYTKGRFRTKVCITFGEPIHITRSADTGKNIQSPQEFLDQIMSQIAKLSGLD